MGSAKEAIKILLDVTAGNRHLHSVKNPENVVFIDREIGLRIKPDVFADFTALPFRGSVFDFAVFDPPHLIHGSGGLRSKWLHSDPFEGRTGHFDSGRYARRTYGSWWGFFRSAESMRQNIARGAEEIHRVLRRDGLMHYKWNNSMQKIMTTILSFARDWIELYRTDRASGTNVSDSRTFWVLFQKRDLGAFRGRFMQLPIDEPNDITPLEKYFEAPKPKQVKLGDL